MDNLVADNLNPYYSNAAARVVFTVGAEATDVVTVGVAFVKPDGRSAGVCSALMYLSDDAAGDSVVGTAASGGVAAGTDGFLLATHTAGKVFQMNTESTGEVDVAVTHSGAKTCYLCVVLPSGRVQVSGVLTFAA